MLRGNFWKVQPEMHLFTSLQTKQSQRLIRDNMYPAYYAIKTDGTAGVMFLDGKIRLWKTPR